MGNIITQNKKNNVYLILTGIISFLGLIFSILLLFPQVRLFIIHFAEDYLIQRKVNFHERWLDTIFTWAKGLLFILSIFIFFTFINPGKILFNQILNEIKFCLSKIDFKHFIKPFFLITGIYLFGLIAIILADFSYIDDIDRALRGFRGWNGWSRHLNDFLSTFIHVDFFLADISPLPQFLAILLMAFSSVLLVYIITGKITCFTIIASIPLFLTPYFLENFSYKFDAPYMALSVFSSVVPFLFITARKAFIFTSIISLLVMCLTYQASSGIYILIVITLCFLDFNCKRKSIKDIFIFIGIAAASYIFSMIFFRLFFFVNTAGGYGVSTEILSLKDIFPGVILNLNNYLSLVINDFGIVWQTIILFLLILFIINSFKQSSYRRITGVIIPVITLILLFIFSYGVFIILKAPLFSPRAFVGLATFLAIVCIYIVSCSSKHGFIAVFALNWCFIVFAFSYGNALADQKRYVNFRVESLLHDLNRLFPDRTSSDPHILLHGNTGYGPYTENISRSYPIIKKLVPNNQFYHVYKYMNGYFHWTEGKKWEEVKYDLPIIFDSYYHIIKSDGSYITVEFKN